MAPPNDKLSLTLALTDGTDLKVLGVLDVTSNFANHTENVRRDQLESAIADLLEDESAYNSAIAFAVQSAEEFVATQA